jgi:ferredoxin-nitrate reductase
MTKTGKVNKLRQHISKPFLEINPLDALTRNIRNDDVVVIDNGRGSVRVRAKITDEIKKGVVFLPMHWGKILSGDLGRANNLTSDLVDPMSKEPDFKFAAVEVAKYVKQPEKVVIVGAGAAAYRFIVTYRGQPRGRHPCFLQRERSILQPCVTARVRQRFAVVGQA